MRLVGAYASQKHLSFCEQVRVGNDGVRHVQVGDHIQRAGSNVTQVWPVEDMDRFFFDGAQKLLTEGEVHVLKHVERDCCCIVSVLEG